MSIRVLCIGDVFGKPGRDAMRVLLPRLIGEHNVDFVITNCENAAGGVGLTIDSAQELLSLPIDVLTSGNHIWRHKEILPFLERQPRLLRPLNYPTGAPGRGYAVCETAKGIKIGVINLIGRVFMDPVPSPFEAVLPVIEEIQRETKVIIVDMHAEATSEKRAMGWYLAGKISAIYGTHTHVQTADEQVLPPGTCYITDVGMTGPHDSVIGMRTDIVLERFLTMLPKSFTAATGGVRLNGIVFEIDETTGRGLSVLRIDLPL